MLAGRLLEYFADQTRLVFNEFLIDEGIAPTTFDRWKKKYKLIDDIHKQIMMTLATRREKGMLQGVIKEKSGMHNMHQYSDDWAQADKYWSDLRKAEQRTYTTEFIPYLEALQSTDGKVITRKCVEGKPIEEKDETEE